ncbi:MAG TPA: tetratricopeptide repeat protein [Pyrinomonadaceae bacterium]|nr:tetratricopeptide repeat protein [Pyrinomonadaceae bacterium]
MKRLLALSLALIVCLVALAPARVSAKESWMSVRSQNFFLVGNAPEKEIRRVATRLEQFRDVFTRLFPNVKFNSPRPTTVVVFKSDGSYKPFKPVVEGKISDVAGYFQPGDDVNYITLTTERASENPYRTIYHEYVHLLMDNSMSKSSVPPWFNEGLAEYYSTFDIDDERKVYLGRLIENHILLLREQQLFPLKTLFEVDYYSLHRNERAARGLFYAQSWALVHYLIVGNGGRRAPQIGRFFDLLERKVPTEQAFKQAFETDFAGMEKELKSYVQRNTFDARVATFDRKLEFDSEMQAAPLSEADAEAYLGDLLLHTHRLEEAEKRLRQSLALDAKNAMAHASLGMLRMRQDKFDEAKRHLREAVALGAGNYLAHYYYAYVISRAGMDDTGRVSAYAPEALTEMRAALKRASELKPDFAEAYHLLAFINLVAGERLNEAVELIKRARTLAPGNEEYALVLAQIYLQQQNFDAARGELEPLTRSASEPQLRANAESLLKAVQSMQQQAAMLKETRAGETGRADTGGTDDSPPRLRRRADAEAEAQAEANAASGRNPEELAAEAFNTALHDALRKPAQDETRTLGTLVRIDCSAKGLVFVVRVGAREMKLQTNSFESLHLMAFTPDAGSELTCGARKTQSAAVVTYRPSKDARAKTDGALVALEFVPAQFKLKQ